MVPEGGVLVKLDWMKSKARAGDEWAAYFLLSAHLKRLRNQTVHSPLEHLPGPEQVRPYYDIACAAAGDADFKTSWDDVIRILVEFKDFKLPAWRGMIAAALDSGWGGSPRDPEGARRVIEEFAGLEDPHALAVYGGALLFGNYGMTKDPDEGLRRLRRAIEGGCASAETSLGFAYWFGLAEKEDLAEAVKHFEAAIEKGDPTAYVALGLMHKGGLGVPHNLRKAAELFREAAERGSGDAMRYLGNAYSAGEGVGKNAKAAVEWWARGNSAGDLESTRLFLGTLVTGNGQKRSVQLARALYPKYFVRTATKPAITAWADKYRRAPRVEKGELLGTISAVRVELELGDSLKRWANESDVRAAIQSEARRAGFKIDDKSKAVLRVQVNAFVKNDSFYNFIWAHARICLPAVIQRGNRLDPVESGIGFAYETGGLPDYTTRLFYGPRVRKIAASVVSSALEGRSTRTTPSLATPVPSKLSDPALFASYKTALALADQLADVSWMGETRIGKPVLQVSGPAVKEAQVQKHWARELSRVGVTIDPQQTPYFHHYLLTSTVKNASFVGSYICYYEGDVMYEVGDRMIRSHGWVHFNENMYRTPDSRTTKVEEHITDFVNYLRLGLE